jgi:hypothetical protein
LKVLAYFDIFSYPLTRDEIIVFLDAAYAPNQIEESFQFLVNEKIIFSLGEYYSLSDNISLAQRRKKGNELAIKQICIAKRLAAFLSRFPYVRGVAVSGSLSKNYADERSDIDFFIITKTNRLWIARTFMHLFKKLTYLAGKQHWFCMNYYLDETALEIQEKNIYTATEVITALQLYGEETLCNFIKANEWVFDFYPLYFSGSNKPEKIRKGVFKTILEFLFDNKTGEQLDTWLMKVTAKRWNRKKELLRKNKKGLLMGMDAGKHFSRAHPGSFQQQVLCRYNNNLSGIFQKLEGVSSKTATRSYAVK